MKKVAAFSSSADSMLMAGFTIVRCRTERSQWRIEGLSWFYSMQTRRGRYSRGSENGIYKKRLL
jgi:hypothetical protein